MKRAEMPDAQLNMVHAPTLGDVATKLVSDARLAGSRDVIMLALHLSLLDASDCRLWA